MLDIGYTYCCVLAFFVTFVCFGLLNILTAIFVESAAKIYEIDRDLVIQYEMDAQNSSVNSLKQVLQSVDTDNSGTITIEEFNAQLEKPETTILLKYLECDVSEAHGL